MTHFHKAEKLQPNTEHMPAALQSDILKGMYHVLSNEVGGKDAKVLLAEAFLWDTFMNRPVWKPELFDLPHTRT